MNTKNFHLTSNQSNHHTQQKPNRKNSPNKTNSPQHPHSLRSADPAAAQPTYIQRPFQPELFRFSERRLGKVNGAYMRAGHVCPPFRIQMRARTKGGPGARLFAENGTRPRFGNRWARLRVALNSGRKRSRYNADNQIVKGIWQSLSVVCMCVIDPCSMVEVLVFCLWNFFIYFLDEALSRFYMR